MIFSKFRFSSDRRVAFDEQPANSPNRHALTDIVMPHVVRDAIGHGRSSCAGRCFPMVLTSGNPRKVSLPPGVAFPPKLAAVSTSWWSQLRGLVGSMLLGND